MKISVKKKKGTLRKKGAEHGGRQPEGLSLPTEVSKPTDLLSDYTTLIFGEKKIGKTSMWQYADRAFFLMCEPGAKALKVYQRPVNNWEECLGYERLLRKDKTFRLIVVDPIDNAHIYCTRYICEKRGIEHPSDEEWGKGWNAVKEEFTRWTNSLMSMGKGVVFISHAQEKEVKTRTGLKYDKIVPTMSNAAREILEGTVDIWAHYGYDDKKRVLTIQGDDHVGAGHRLRDHFLTPDQKSRLKVIPMGRSPKEAYANFVAAFNNKLGRA